MDGLQQNKKQKSSRRLARVRTRRPERGLPVRLVHPRPELNRVVRVPRLRVRAAALDVPRRAQVGAERPVRRPAVEFFRPVPVVQVEPAFEQHEVLVPRVVQGFQRGDRALATVAAAHDDLRVFFIRKRILYVRREVWVQRLIREHLRARGRVEAISGGPYQLDRAHLVRPGYDDGLEHAADRPGRRVRELTEEFDLLLRADVDDVPVVVPQRPRLFHVRDEFLPRVERVCRVVAGRRGGRRSAGGVRRPRRQTRDDVDDARQQRERWKKTRRASRAGLKTTTGRRERRVETRDTPRVI
eukprot:31122-Pelagococcus_subviridis.AAC.16